MARKLTIGDCHNCQGMSNVGVGLCGKLELIVCAAIYLSLQAKHKSFHHPDICCSVELSGAHSCNKHKNMCVHREHQTIVRHTLFTPNTLACWLLGVRTSFVSCCATYICHESACNSGLMKTVAVNHEHLWEVKACKISTATSIQLPGATIITWSLMHLKMPQILCRAFAPSNRFAPHLKRVSKLCHT